MNSASNMRRGDSSVLPKSIFFIRQGYHSNKYVCVDLPNCRLDEYYQEYREELKEISKTSFWNVLFPYQIESTDQSYDEHHFG